jgi:hypothetical protein
MGASKNCAIAPDLALFRPSVPAENALQMDPLAARQILQTLVQGFDPSSGAELPAGTPLQQADVIRALLAGITALEAQAVRTRRRAQLPENVGRPWSPGEEQRLVASFHSGEPLPAIAAQHRRTVAALEVRLERLGLLAPEQRTTRNRYVPGRTPSSIR